MLNNKNNKIVSALYKSVALAGYKSVYQPKKKNASELVDVKVFQNGDTEVQIRKRVVKSKAGVVTNILRDVRLVSATTGESTNWLDMKQGVDIIVECAEKGKNPWYQFNG